MSYIIRVHSSPPVAYHRASTLHAMGLYQRLNKQGKSVEVLKLELCPLGICRIYTAYTNNRKPL